MSNVLTKPMCCLKIHLENKEKKKSFRTTENIKVKDKQKALEVLSDLLSQNSKKITKAWYNGKEITLP